MLHTQNRGFTGGSDEKESLCNAGELGLIPSSGRFLGEGNGNSLQYSCLENPTDRGIWQATVHGVSKSQTPLSVLCLAQVFEKEMSCLLPEGAPFLPWVLCI